MVTMDNFIQIDTHYTRSINLERDHNSREILSAYIPTSRALQTLDKIANTFNMQDMPRAWGLVGPYGSGKSSFAVFLAHLLENQELETCVLAENLLQASSLALAEQFIAHTRSSNAYCILVLTGSPEPLLPRFVNALYYSAKNYRWPTAVPAIVKKLYNATQQKLTISEVQRLLTDLQQSIARVSGKGLLIVIDELGKFLEYEARHQEANDLFLLQMLAEFSIKGHAANVLLLVLMHQNFEHYAKGLGESARNEWLKVSGRFEISPFLESAEQTLRVVARAFKTQLDPVSASNIQQTTNTIIQVLAKQHALPSGLPIEAAKEILVQCYPLHPVTALLLPVLCQKVAQNERTLFSYLGSQEHYGFKDSLQRLHALGDWVLPWEIFEYFIHNQPLATTDHLLHRRWAEVMTALERLGDSLPIDMQMLKTIGLFNIIGGQHGLKASQELLLLCFPDPEQSLQSLERLQQKSLLNFRKFNSEYRIWEGSDFDLQASVQETLQSLGRFSLAEVLNRRNLLLPLVARRYSIQTGTLRYFNVLFCDAITTPDSIQTAQVPHIILYLAENHEGVERFNQLMTRQPEQMTLYALCNNAATLKIIVAEVMALERILAERAEIKTDPVSQREIKDHLSTLKHREAILINYYLESPETCQWYWQGNSIQVNHKRHLQQQLSTILESIYPLSPLLKNELVNRNKPSGQANAAKNKLVAALLTQAQCEDLGFEPDKYPAEKSIYRAIFKETSIHRQEYGLWQLLEPLPDNPCGLYPVWQAIHSFLQQGQAPKALLDLYALLEKPPFGISKGLLSLLFVGYYLSQQRSLALYESGVFCPQVTQENFEILLKRPELFSIEAFDFSGIRAELFNRYLEKLVGKAPEDSTLLDIVKPLAKFIAKLPEYTLHTKELPNAALAVRDAFQQTQSPLHLLFDVLPKACGFSSFTSTDFVNNEDSNQNPAAFLNNLVQQLNTLNKAYDQLLQRFQTQLANALHEDSQLTLSSLRTNLHDKYAGLENYTADAQGLKAFILRLNNHKDSDVAWLESIAAFLSKAPPTKWRLSNQTTAEYKLIELSSRLLQLAKVHAHQLKTNSSTQATLLRMVTEQGEIDLIAYLNDDLKQQAHMVLAQINQHKPLNKHLKLAILAELMRELNVNNQ